MNLDSPRCWQNPKILVLVITHLVLMVLLKGLRHMANGRGYYENQGWAQVGQVDLS